MIIGIFKGVKEVVIEVVTGIVEVFESVEVKLMGSYEEIEAYEKEKENKK